MDRRIIEAELKNIFGLIASCFDRSALLKKLAISVRPAIISLLNDAKIDLPKNEKGEITFNPEKIISNALGPNNRDEDLATEVLYKCFFPEALPSKGKTSKSVIESFKDARKLHDTTSEGDLETNLKEVKKKLKEDHAKLEAKEKEEDDLGESDEDEDKSKKLRSEIEELEDSIADSEHKEALMARSLKYKGQNVEDNFVKYFTWFAKKRIEDLKRSKARGGDSLAALEDHIESEEQKLKSVKDPEQKENLEKSIARLKKKLVNLSGSHLYKELADSTTMDQIQKIQDVLNEKEFKSYKEDLYSFSKKVDTKASTDLKDAAVKTMRAMLENDLSVEKDRETLAKSLGFGKDKFTQVVNIVKQIIAKFAVDHKEKGNERFWRALLSYEGIKMSDKKMTLEQMHIKDPHLTKNVHSWESIVDETYNSKTKSPPNVKLDFIPRDIFNAEVKKELDKLDISKQKNKKEEKNEKKEPFNPALKKEEPKAARVAAYISKLCEMFRELD